MANYKGFDLNYLDTPKPWAPRESQAWEDLIDTVVGDAITVGKEVSGHQHNKLYSPVGVAGIEIGAAGDAQILNLATAGVVTNQATGSLGTVPILPINLGGTNSDTPLNNGRVMVSSGGAIVESAVLEAEIALLSGITAKVTGTSNNDKIVTQGYVDDVASGKDEFIELTDTPSSYATHAGKLVAVNSTPDGLEFIANNSVNWDTAYSHSQITTGNPHSISFSDLDGNPSDVITAGTNISWVGNTLNVTGVGSTTFLGLTDTPGSYSAGRVLFESGLAVTDSARITWDNANEILDISNDDISSALSTLRFRKSRNGGSYIGGDNIGQIVFEGYNGATWDQFGKIIYYDVPGASPELDQYVGSAKVIAASHQDYLLFPDSGYGLYVKDSRHIGTGTVSPFQAIGAGANDLTSTHKGIHVKNTGGFAGLVLEGQGPGANGSYEGDGSAQIILAMTNTPTGVSTGVKMKYGDYLMQFTGVEETMVEVGSAFNINVNDRRISCATGESIGEFSADDTLADDSNTAVPTEAAVKGYVDNAVSVLPPTPYTNGAAVVTSAGNMIESIGLFVTNYAAAIGGVAPSGTRGLQISSTGTIYSAGSGTNAGLNIVRNGYYGSGIQRLKDDNDAVRLLLNNDASFDVTFQSDANDTVDSEISWGISPFNISKASGVVVNPSSVGGAGYDFIANGDTKANLLRTNSANNTVGIGVTPDSGGSSMLLAFGFPTETAYLWDITATDPVATNEVKWLKWRTGTGSQVYYIKMFTP